MFLARTDLQFAHGAPGQDAHALRVLSAGRPASRLRGRPHCDHPKQTAASLRADYEARVLELERSQVQRIRLFHRGECDRQVLNREAGRVEDRRLVVAAPSLGIAGEDIAELCDVFTRELPGLERVNELSVVARLLSVTHEQKVNVGTLPFGKAAKSTRVFSGREETTLRLATRAPGGKGGDPALLSFFLLALALVAPSPHRA